MTKEPSFPWDMLDAETLRNIGRQIGLGDSRSRDELLEFLQDVERHEVRRALDIVEAKDRKKLEAKREAETPRKRAREPEPELSDQGSPGPSRMRSGMVPKKALLHPRRRMVINLPSWSDLQAQRRKALDSKVSRDESGTEAPPRKYARESEPELMLQSTPGPSRTRQENTVENASATPAKRMRRTPGLQVEIVLPRWSDLRRQQGTTGSKTPRQVATKDLKGKIKQKEEEETAGNKEETTGGNAFDYHYDFFNLSSDSSEGYISGSTSESHADAIQPLALKDLRFLVEPRDDLDGFWQTVYLTIKTVENKAIGEMMVYAIRRAQAIKECGSVFDALQECELDEFANEVFICGLPEYDGYLQNPECLEMLTPWWEEDEFIDESPLVYVEDIFIREKWRGKGIGTWAYNHLLSLPEFKGAKYMFARPAYGKAENPEEARSVAFHRKVGFRRIGPSAFFAWAKDPNHPSRAVPPSNDCPYDAQIVYF